MNPALKASLPMSLLEPWGRALLIAGFGFLLVRAMRGSEDLSLAFERLTIGMLALVLYRQGAEVLVRLSEELIQALRSAGDRNELKILLLDALRAAAASPTPTGGKPGINLPAISEQVFRIGVWGVMTLIVDWLFMLASLLIESAHAVFWKLILFLFPLACGIYPFFPRILSNLLLYALELSLWTPFLIVIERVTAEAAKARLARDGSLGLAIVAVELIAAFLILSIPAVTHKFLSGAFAGDFGSGASLIGAGKRFVFQMKGLVAR